MTETHDMPECACPWCGYLVDRASSLFGDYKPTPGDQTMCIECGRWCIFDDKLGLRRPTKAEGFELSQSPEVKETTAAWRRMQNIPGMRRGRVPRET